MEYIGTEFYWIAMNDNIKMIHDGRVEILESSMIAILEEFVVSGESVGNHCQNWTGGKYSTRLHI